MRETNYSYNVGAILRWILSSGREKKLSFEALSYVSSISFTSFISLQIRIDLKPSFFYVHQITEVTHRVARRLVEAEAGGGVGEDVGVDGVRDVRLPVGDGALLGGEALHDAAEPREHGEAAVLELLDLELLEVTGLGEAEGVEAATGGHVTDGELVEDGVGEAGAVRLGEADEDDLDGEDGPEGGVARTFGGEGRDGAGELVRDGGAVIGGAQGTRGEPGDAGAVLGGPGAGDAKHGPAAVDDFTLGVLLGAEGDDGGLATAGVGAEFGVDVRLDHGGHRLGLFLGKGNKEREGQARFPEDAGVSDKTRDRGDIISRGRWLEDRRGV